MVYRWMAMSRVSGTHGHLEPYSKDRRGLLSLETDRKHPIAHSHRSNLLLYI